MECYNLALEPYPNRIEFIPPLPIVIKGCLDCQSPNKHMNHLIYVGLGKIYFS